MRNALERATDRECDHITGDDLVDIDRLFILFEDEMPDLKRRDFAGLANLQSLDLHFLTELPPRIFGGLTDLQSLDLSGNALTELPPNAFDSLTNLQTLDLRNNPGSPFEVIHPNADLQCWGCRMSGP